MGSKAYTDASLPIISLPNLATPQHSHATSANQHLDHRDELLPAAREYGKPHVAIWGMVVGMIIMATSVILIM